MTKKNQGDYKKIRRVRGVRHYRGKRRHGGGKALCREQDFDVIILDIMMPELDGFFNLPGDPQDQKHSGDHAVGTRRRV